MGPTSVDPRLGRSIPKSAQGDRRRRTGLGGESARIETFDEVTEGDRRVRSETDRGCDPVHDLGGTDPGTRCEIGHRDRRATPLGESVTVGVDHQRHMHIGRLRVPEEALQMDLSRGRRQQIVPAHHLGDTLGSVIDDDGEVVRRDPVVSTQDDVVDQPAEPAVDHVVDVDLMSIRAQPECGASPLATPVRAFAGGEIAARARIRAWRTVRCGSGGFDLVADLAARAVALVDEIAGGEVVDRSVVASKALTLADDGTVPVDADGGEIVELRLLDSDVCLTSIEVLHADDEFATA